MIPRFSALGRGRLYALGSAISFGMVAPLAGLAYAGGASPGSAVMARLSFGLLTGALAVFLLNRPWIPRRATWKPTLVIAVAWTALTVGYMASFFYIPVSLAVLIFFTFPVLIAVAAPLADGGSPQSATVLAALVAFIGLGFALGPEITGLDWRGCSLAFLASLGATSAFILSRRLLAEQDMFAFSLHLHVLCVGAVLATFTMVGPPALPGNPLAWTGLLGVGVFYAVAVLLQFAAIRLAGPARASIMFNAEPIVTMAVAAIVLAEHLGAWQMMGAVLVIGAVLWSARVDRTHAPGRG